MKLYIVMRAEVEGWLAGGDARIGRVLGVYEDEAQARIARYDEHDFDTPAWIEVWEGGQMVESIPPLVAKENAQRVRRAHRPATRMNTGGPAQNRTGVNGFAIRAGLLLTQRQPSIGVAASLCRVGDKMQIANREGGAVCVPEVGPEAATRVATRNRLPVGPTEAELLTGYQNTSTPAQGWFEAGHGHQLLPTASDEVGGDGHRATCGDSGSVTSPARASSSAGGAS